MTDLAIERSPHRSGVLRTALLVLLIAAFVALRAARVPHLFRLYPGGHTQALWSAHAVEWLDRGLAQLAQ